MNAPLNYFVTTHNSLQEEIPYATRVYVVAQVKEHTHLQTQLGAEQPRGIYRNRCSAPGVKEEHLHVQDELNVLGKKVDGLVHLQHKSGCSKPTDSLRCNPTVNMLWS